MNRTNKVRIIVEYRIAVEVETTQVIPYVSGFVTAIVPTLQSEFDNLVSSVFVNTLIDERKGDSTISQALEVMEIQPELGS